MKQELKYLFFFCIFLLQVNFSNVFADGMFVSDNKDMLLYYPDQKAVISWDGQTQEMVIASSIRTDKIANVAWIVPLRSAGAPQVFQSDSDIFKDLAELFKTRREDKDPGVMGDNILSSVEVFSSQKIDIYDVTVLKAGRTDDLLEWLKANGYSVSDAVREAINYYMSYSDIYFVANKINLLNKYADIQQASVQVREEMVQEQKKRIEQMKAEEEELMSNIGDGCQISSVSGEKYEMEIALSFCSLERISKKLNEKGYIFESSAIEPPFENVYQLKSESGWVIRVVDFSNLDHAYMVINDGNQNVLTDFYPRQDRRDFAVGKDTSGSFISEKQKAYATELADVMRDFLGESIAEIAKIEKVRGLVAEEQAVLNQIPNADDWYEFVCRYHDREDFSVEADQIKEFCGLKSLLNSGMATPLKFVFQPSEPMYPLRISSVGEGSSAIDVYVFSDQDFIDKNGLVQKADTKNLYDLEDASLDQRVADKINTFGSKRVTRFVWRGHLKDLYADAVFAVK